MLKYLFIAVLLSSSCSIAIEKQYDVVAIGEAMVDIIAFVPDKQLSLLKSKGLKKSDTTRINDQDAEEIIASIKDYQIIPGGSEANVIADIASLGGKTAFHSVIADDKYGNLFKESLIKEGVDYLSRFNTNSSKNTALCLTFITPDKERTFAVSGAITGDIEDSYINYNAIKNSKIFYTDASNLDGGKNKSIVTDKALSTATSNFVSIAFNLNNNFFVNKNREEILKLLSRVNILIGGESEAKNLFKVSTVDDVLEKALEYVDMAVITLGKDGAVIATKEKQIYIPTQAKEEKIADLNGAGDAFAAGFLYGYSQGYDLEKSGIIAAKTAAHIIYQMGARPNSNLSKELLGNI